MSGQSEGKEPPLTQEREEEEEEEEDEDRKVSPADPAAGQKKAVCLWQKGGGPQFHLLAPWDSGLPIGTWALHFLGPSNAMLLLDGNS